MARPLLLFTCLLLAACTGTKRAAVEGAFPVPLMAKTPVNLGIYLDEELVAYEHKETIEKKGQWEVSIGPAQPALFENLASGVFESHVFVASNVIDAPWDGVLKPAIEEVQFSLPDQTRSNYYEVWIRYQFQLYDRQGGLLGEWQLPAYGKASNKNHGSATTGLQAAAMAACRDAMAFFSINFSREPVVRKWLAAGKPLAPANPPGAATANAQGTPTSPQGSAPVGSATPAPAVNTSAPPTPATDADEAAGDSEEGNSA